MSRTDREIAQGLAFAAGAGFAIGFLFWLFGVPVG